MKTINGVIIGVILVAVIIIGILSYQKNNQDSANSGSLIIGITDATAEISNVNDIDLSVNKVEVYSKSKGWVTTSSETKSYKLLSLQSSGKIELYTKVNIDEGIYEKVRVTLGDVVVKTKTKGDIKATLPSKYVVISGAVKVKRNEDSTIKLDILADQSLHTTIDGGYVFTPVIKTESKSKANVSIDSNEALLISGGSIDSETTVGVDFDGISKLNFKAESDNSLKVESSIDGRIKLLLGGKIYQESDVSGETNMTDNSNKLNIKSDSSVDIKDDSEDDSINVNLKEGIKVN